MPTPVTPNPPSPRRPPKGYMDEATALLHDINPEADNDQARKHIANAVAAGMDVDLAWRLWGANLPGARPVSNG